MKPNRKYPTWALLLIFFAVIIAGCSKDDAPPTFEEVTIPDPLLLAQIKIALGLDESEEVNTENILGLDTLDLDAGSDVTGDVLGGIEDLTGLEFAENLVYLHLGNTSITDLGPIQGLEKISYLRFNNTSITDISPLSGYTSLTYFNANTVTGLTDISPLSGNTGLKVIILREVPFGNEGMETIANFTSLYRINMRGTGVTDISVLAELMEGGALLDTTPGAEAAGGADLDLRGLSVTDWSPIASYVSQIANIEGTPDIVNDIVPDELLLAQIRIVLGVGGDQEINSLHMTGVDTLNLDAENDLSGALSGISNITGLEYAENLIYLRLGATSVTDLSPIADLTTIQYFRINDTDITDLSPISGFTSLTYFNANSVTGITDISPLAGNTGMKEIILRSVPFGNGGMSTIRNFEVLYRINMRNTGVTDISVLGELMELGALLDSTEGAEEAGGADLDLRQLEVNDWSPIEPFIDQISTLDGYPG